MARSRTAPTAGFSRQLTSRPRALPPCVTRYRRQARGGAARLARPRRSGAAAVRGAEPGADQHWLWRAGLIDSPEVRLPMTEVSDALATRIANEMVRRTGARDVAA
jgi:hypothetical protein